MTANIPRSSPGFSSRPGADEAGAPPFVCLPPSRRFAGPETAVGCLATDDLPAMRILVVEDERQLARHITRALERHGHSLRTEHDGALGLQSALDEPPDLVVLDLNLPSLDGLAVLAQLRSANSPARVLILTARGEVDDRVKGLKAGADDYLAKPFSVDELIARGGRFAQSLRPADGRASSPRQPQRPSDRALPAGIGRAAGPDAGAGPGFFPDRAV